MPKRLTYIWPEHLGRTFTICASTLPTLIELGVEIEKVYPKLNKDQEPVYIVIPGWVRDVTIDLAETIDSLTYEPRKFLLGLIKRPSELVQELECLDRGVSGWVDVCEESWRAWSGLVYEDEVDPDQAASVLCGSRAICVVTKEEVPEDVVKKILSA
jgi:hypothetical protein